MPQVGVVLLANEIHGEVGSDNHRRTLEQCRINIGGDKLQGGAYLAHIVPVSSTDDYSDHMVWVPCGTAAHGLTMSSVEDTLGRNRAMEHKLQSAAAALTTYNSELELAAETIHQLKQQLERKGQVAQQPAVQQQPLQKSNSQVEWNQVAAMLEAEMATMRAQFVKSRMLKNQNLKIAESLREELSALGKPNGATAGRADSTDRLLGMVQILQDPGALRQPEMRSTGVDKPPEDSARMSNVLSKLKDGRVLSLMEMLCNESTLTRLESTYGSER